MTIALNGGTLPASERALRGAGLPVHEQEFLNLLDAPGSSPGRCRGDLRKRLLTCGDERPGSCVHVLAVAPCSSSLSAVLRTECGLGLVLPGGLLTRLERDPRVPVPLTGPAPPAGPTGTE